jgi:hypothetical protein
MQCVVAGRDKHLERVETRRSAPSVETLKLTDTKQPALSECIGQGIAASPAQGAHHSLLQMRRGRTRLRAMQPQTHVPGIVTWRPLAGPAGPL